MSHEEMRVIREALNKNQREMAETLGVFLRTYTRWERNERPIPGPAVLLARKLFADHKDLNKNTER